MTIRGQAIRIIADTAAPGTSGTVTEHHARGILKALDKAGYVIERKPVEVVVEPVTENEPA